MEALRILAKVALSLCPAEGLGEDAGSDKPQNIEYYAKARWHLFYARGTS
jgi:hypothetical protein